MTKTIIGIDISKDRLDAYRLADGTRKVFENTAAGYAQLLDFLGADAAQVVFEATGQYHRRLERALGQAGVPFVKVNPCQAKRFGQAYGMQAKTDPGDAELLARMARALDLPETPTESETQFDLKALQVARQALVKDRTAARTRQEHLHLTLLKRQNARRLAQIEKDLAAIDARITALVDADADLAERKAILLSLKGISDVTAQALLTLMPELGRLGGPQIAKLAGVAPITRRSGKWVGTSYTKGGRHAVRHALYMPTLSAMRWNTDIKAFADRLKAAGKPGLVVVTAAMRKLLIFANALIRDRRKWTEKPT